MKALRSLTAAWLLYSLASPVLAATAVDGRLEAQSATSIPFKNEARSGEGSTERIAGTWIAVVAALGGALWFLKRKVGAVTPRTGPRTGPMHIVQTVRLAPQTTLHVVDFGNQRILIAQTPQGVSRVASTVGPTSLPEST